MANEEQERRTAVQERRFKAVYVREDEVLTLFRCGMDDWPECLKVPDWREVPKDAVLLRVWFEPSVMGFGFLLAHESFEPVPLGAIPPTLVTSTQLRAVYLAGQDIEEHKDPEA